MKTTKRIPRAPACSYTHTQQNYLFTSLPMVWFKQYGKRIKDDNFGQAVQYLYRSGYRQGRHPLLQIWTRLTITRQHMTAKPNCRLLFSKSKPKNRYRSNICALGEGAGVGAYQVLLVELLTKHGWALIRDNTVSTIQSTVPWKQFLVGVTVQCTVHHHSLN